MAAVKKKPISKKMQAVLDDFPLFAKNMLFILDNTNSLVKFELNEAQIEINELQKTNRFVCCGKSRQAGISTYVIGRALWRAVTKPNENILIVSYKEDSAVSLFNMLKRFNQYLPREKYPDVFPEIVRDNRNELIFTNGSKVMSSCAGSKDIGRGSTYSYIHLSEYSFFTKQEIQLLSSEQALQKNSESQLTIETTSNGISNHWYRLYSRSWKGESKYKAHFVKWYHKLYLKQFSHDINEAVEWYKSKNGGKKLSAKDLDPDEQFMYKDGATLKQLSWRRFKLQDMTLSEFQQEFPSNYIESFVSSGSAIFEPSILLTRLQHIVPPLSKKELVNELPKELHKFIGKGLDVFYLPKRGVRYYMGVDSSAGVGGDNSTITLLDADGQQVLSFYHNKTPIYEFAEVVNTIGHYYNEAFICAESNSFGTPLLETLRKQKQYVNLFKHKHFNQVGKRIMKLGFTTSSTTKSTLINDLKTQFELGLINLECKETLGEMQIYQMNKDGSMGNKRGASNHDDLVISAALAVQAIKASKWYV